MSPAVATMSANNSSVAVMPVVLVVDDDAPLRRMLSLTLRDGGFSVRSATNGRTALEDIDAEQLPDAIVLDLEMPVMDGRAFFHEIRERGVRTPVIVVSAYGARGAQRELGAEGYLDKPFNPDDLVERVRAVL